MEVLTRSVLLIHEKELSFHLFYFTFWFIWHILNFTLHSQREIHYLVTFLKNHIYQWFFKEIISEHHITDNYFSLNTHQVKNILHWLNIISAPVSKSNNLTHLRSWIQVSEMYLNILALSLNSYPLIHSSLTHLTFLIMSTISFLTK